MSTAVIWYGGTTPDYQADFERSQNAAKPRRSRKTTSTTRRAARPVGYNGMHRRRKKRWSW